MEAFYFSYKHAEQYANWEEALYQVASDALHEKVLSALYLKDVVDVVQESQVMLVINDNTALFHARPNEHVRKNCICYLQVDQRIPFFKKTLKHIFLFGAQTPSIHIKMLKTVTQFTMEASTSPDLYDKETMQQFFTNHMKL